MARDHTPLLSGGDLDYLSGMARHDAAMQIAQGHVGPLQGFGASPGVALIAYGIWRAWSHSMAGGMLATRKVYEARELLGHRVRASMETSLSLADWLPRLFDLVGCNLDRVSASELAWWRGRVALYAEEWDALSDRTAVEEALQTFAILQECMTEIRKLEAAA